MYYCCTIIILCYYYYCFVIVLTWCEAESSGLYLRLDFVCIYWSRSNMSSIVHIGLNATFTRWHVGAKAPLSIKFSNPSIKCLAISCTVMLNTLVSYVSLKTHELCLKSKTVTVHSKAFNDIKIQKTGMQNRQNRFLKFKQRLLCCYRKAGAYYYSVTNCNSTFVCHSRHNAKFSWGGFFAILQNYASTVYRGNEKTKIANILFILMWLVWIWCPVTF